MLQMNMVRSRL